MKNFHLWTISIKLCKHFMTCYISSIHQVHSIYAFLRTFDAAQSSWFCPRCTTGVVDKIVNNRFILSRFHRQTGGQVQNRLADK